MPVTFSDEDDVLTPAEQERADELSRQPGLGSLRRVGLAKAIRNEIDTDLLVAAAARMTPALYINGRADIGITDAEFTEGIEKGWSLVIYVAVRRMGATHTHLRTLLDAGVFAPDCLIVWQVDPTACEEVVALATAGLKGVTTLEWGPAINAYRRRPDLVTEIAKLARGWTCSGAALATAARMSRANRDAAKFFELFAPGWEHSAEDLFAVARTCVRPVSRSVMA